MRLLEAVADPEQRRLLRVRLTLSDAAPELVASRLATADETPPESRRAVQLRRWEVAVALGDLDQAAVERDEWQRVTQSTDAPADVQSKLDEEDLLESIQIAALKLEQSRGVPFSRELARQWELSDSELVIDQRNLPDLLRPWKLVRNRHAFTLALHRCDSSGPALTTTPDALNDPRVQRQNIELGRERELRAATSEAPAVWSAAVHKRLAAVPVRGGLVCLGLGPERDGGKRLWDIPTADLMTPPDRFLRLSACVDAGVAIGVETDVVEMRDWTDGRARWRRRFPAPLLALQPIAGDVAVLTSDETVRIVRGTDGAEAQALTLDGGIKRLETVGSHLLIWSATGVHAIDPRTGAELWSRHDALPRFAPIADSDWAVLTSEQGDTGIVIDLSDGADVFPKRLDSLGIVTAAAVSGDRLLVAGLLPGEDGAIDDDQGTIVRVSIYPTNSATRLAAPAVRSFVPINETQLVASERYVPVLRIGPSEPGQATFGIRPRFVYEPRIVLIDKQTGEALVDVVAADQQPPRTESDSYPELRLLATPTRVLVQVGNRVFAYGISSLSRSP
ncbi:MAG: hypothetical protein KDA32_13080, partial [Phycisphaerales bacterium]|nr:hypothetical protein [Phycisphaerales bacterium]